MADQEQGGYGADNGVQENKWSQNGYGEGVPASSGKFSKAESEKVRKAIKEYCTARQISVARLCSECDHKAELKGAWMEIAKVLPERSVQSVYRHGLRQMHPFKRGLWTEEECEMLETLVARLGKKWASIQEKLNRSADSCRDKYREMSDSYTRGRWKENETELLKRLIRDHLNADPRACIKELGRQVEAKGIKIPWSIISKRMGKRSRLSCFKKWQKMTGLHTTYDTSKAASTASPRANSGIKMEDTGEDDVEETPVPAVHAKAPSARTAKNVPPRPGTTAGAAALAASIAANNPIGGQTGDVDSYLLSELANLDATRMSDVDWESIRVDNARERWTELFEELQSSLGDESTMSLPLSSVAQMILDRKTSAQQAAETVEAVDLPEV